MRSSLALALAVLAGCGANQTVPPDHAPYVPGDAGAISCLPNLDGQIDADEMPVALGTPESLLVNPAGTTVSVDLVGQIDDQGQRVWDYSVDDGSDQIATLTAQPLQGKWYASSFPEGQFVSATDLADSIEAVYQKTDDGLYALGLASSTEHPADGQTLYVYDQPVALYRFPLTPGRAWTSTGTFRNGLFHNLPYAGSDTYAVSVESAGMLELPDESFTQALRVKTTVTVQPSAGTTLVTQQSAWVFECFGEVMRATSAAGETNPDFTTAVELRRLTNQRSTP